MFDRILKIISVHWKTQESRILFPIRKTIETILFVTSPHQPNQRQNYFITQFKICLSFIQNVFVCTM